jgi:predicted AlkP superfamily phosphohydrolase/phosphomutase
MSKQKLIFLYSSPPGEAVLNAMLREHINSLAAKDGKKVVASFTRAIHKSPNGHAIRVWFNVEYSDELPEIVFLKRFLAAVPVEDIFFARIGEDPDDFEEIGSYTRRSLPKVK